MDKIYEFKIGVLISEENLNGTETEQDIKNSIDLLLDKGHEELLHEHEEREEDEIDEDSRLATLISVTIV